MTHSILVSCAVLCQFRLHASSFSARPLSSLEKSLINKLFKNMTDFDSVPAVEIDSNGTFKYILIKLYEKGKSNDDGSEKFKYLVRGNARGAYHGDIYDEFMSKLSKKLDSECVGGGRIKHDADEKKIHVYGYSQGFGKADHSISKELLCKKYPDYEIDWSDEGY